VQERRYSEMRDNQHIKPSILTTDRIPLDCLSMAKRRQALKSQDPVKRMPPGGCALLEGSHHRYKDTRDEMLER
jgi:hypothetical protein